MVKLELTNIDTPDDVLARANRFGRESIISGEYKRHLAVNGVGGLYIFEAITVEDSCKVKVIDLTNASFACTPRVYGKNDGYDESGLEQGNGSLDYPLEDNTDTTAMLGCKEGEIVLSRDAQLYGNIDWISKDGTTLTWKGPTGRSLPFNNDLPIAGLTTSDISFSDTATTKFTCFGPNIYSQGSILTTVPTILKDSDDKVIATSDCEPKVLGCAIQNEKLVCIVNNHYADKIGFFEEVWVLYDIWEKIYTRELNVGRPKLIWAFNQSGTKATQGIYEYSIDIENKVASVVMHPQTDIKFKIVRNSEGTSTEYSGSQQLWSDYKGDVRVTAVVNASGGQTFSSSTTETGSSQKVPVLIQGEKPAFTISGPTLYSGGQYTTTGGIGEITISLPSRSCGTATVTATDSCGSTASMQVKMAEGGWVLSDCYTDTTILPPYSSQTITTDLTKAVEDVGVAFTPKNVTFPQWDPGQQKCIDQTYTQVTQRGRYPQGPGQEVVCFTVDDGHCTPTTLCDDKWLYGVRQGLYYVWGCVSDPPNSEC